MLQLGIISFVLERYNYFAVSSTAHYARADTVLVSNSNYLKGAFRYLRFLYSSIYNQCLKCLVTICAQNYRRLTPLHFRPNVSDIVRI
jgi:hypothetical protein